MRLSLNSVVRCKLRPSWWTSELSLPNSRPSTVSTLMISSPLVNSPKSLATLLIMKRFFLRFAMMMTRLLFLTEPLSALKTVAYSISVKSTVKLLTPKLSTQSMRRNYSLSLMRHGARPSSMASETKESERTPHVDDQYLIASWIDVRRFEGLKSPICLSTPYRILRWVYYCERPMKLQTNPFSCAVSFVSFTAISSHHYLKLNNIDYKRILLIFLQLSDSHVNFPLFFF